MTQTISRAIEAPIDAVEVAAYAIPTDAHESDGTFEWDKTTLVVCHVRAGDETGLGYTYADASTAKLIDSLLADVVRGIDAFNIPEAWHKMVAAIRNLGRPGIASMAISAVDVALWDLKAKLLGVPLVTLLGAARPGAPIYGSGGFTSYSDAQLRGQLSGWVAQGIGQVKIKIGRDAKADVHRVRTARKAIGDGPQLYVDANGAYNRKQALAQAEMFASEGVTWFEEPVSSDDLEGLRLMRDRGPAGMAIAAGEYGYDLYYFRRMLEAGAVDVLQVDGTRAGGITGFMAAAALAASHGLDISAHCAPSLHTHPCCALANVRPMEYFHDHERIEHMLFDGTLSPVGGDLRPDLSRPGLGWAWNSSKPTRNNTR
jgi:L-alanine-DL-glutamate epimerase-like enolase superfamily enzyme